MSEDKKSAAKKGRPGYGVLVLATVLSVIGACAMAGSVVIGSFARRFPNPAGANFAFNATRPFNGTRGFNPQVVAQRAPPTFTYTTWLNILGLACLVAIAIMLVVLLFQSRSSNS